MHSPCFRSTVIGALGAAIALLIPLAAAARDVTDMLGNTVAVPDRIERLITVGAVPVLNTYVFAAGKGEHLAMGLPANFDRSLSRFQFVFAPQMADNPAMQDPNLAPDLEKILAAAPDVAITFEQASADLLKANGVPAVLMRIGTPEEIKAGVRLVGEMFGEPGLGDRYAAYFDRISAHVAERVAGVPAEKRPSVLYLNPVIMTQPHLIAEWWIPAGGGASVTDDGRSENVLSLTKEAVIGADPDFILVMEPKHIKVLREDPVLSQLAAVKDGRVLVSPRGAHVWGNRAVELALTPLWLASVLHPDLIPHDELVTEATAFYAAFFKRELTREQIEDILAGGQERTQ